MEANQIETSGHEHALRQSLLEYQAILDNASVGISDG